MTGRRTWAASEVDSSSLALQAPRRRRCVALREASAFTPATRWNASARWYTWAPRVGPDALPSSADIRRAERCGGPDQARVKGLAAEGCAAHSRFHLLCTA